MRTASSNSQVVGPLAESNVREGIREGDDAVAMQQQLTELYRLIRFPMDETFEAQDQDLKVLLVSLEYQARQYKRGNRGDTILNSGPK